MRADAVYVHLDPDVIDPSEFRSSTHVADGGLTISQVAEAFREIAARFDLLAINLSAWTRRSILVVLRYSSRCWSTRPSSPRMEPEVCVARLTLAHVVRRWDLKATGFDPSRSLLVQSAGILRLETRSTRPRVVLNRTRSCSVVGTPWERRVAGKGTYDCGARWGPRHPEQTTPGLCPRKRAAATATAPQRPARDRGIALSVLRLPGRQGARGDSVKRTIAVGTGDLRGRFYDELHVGGLVVAEH